MKSIIEILFLMASLNFYCSVLSYKLIGKYNFNLNGNLKTFQIYSESTLISEIFKTSKNVEKIYQIANFRLIKNSCSELNLASTPQPKLTYQIDLKIQKSSKSENKIYVCNLNNQTILKSKLSQINFNSISTILEDIESTI